MVTLPAFPLRDKRLLEEASHRVVEAWHNLQAVQTILSGQGLHHQRKLSGASDFHLLPLRQYDPHQAHSSR